VSKLSERAAGVFRLQPPFRLLEGSYFFFAAFFFVAFFFAAFFLVAILDLHVGLIRGASIYMVDGNASKLYATRRVHRVPLVRAVFANSSRSAVAVCSRSPARGCDAVIEEHEKQREFPSEMHSARPIILPSRR